MKVLFISAEWVFNCCSPSSQVNSRGSVHLFCLILLWEGSSSSFLVWSFLKLLEAGVVYLGTGCSLTEALSKESTQSSAVSSLGHGNKQSVGSKTQNFRAGGESKAGKQKKQLNHMAAPLLLYPQPKPTGNPSPSLRLCSPNRTESPSLGHKNLFHSSLMRAGLLLVKAFTLKTHFWKWSCSLCCQSSSENLKLSKKPSHRGICWCPISLAVVFV